MEPVANVRYATYEDYLCSAQDQLNQVSDDLYEAIESLDLEPDSQEARNLTKIADAIVGVLSDLETLPNPDVEDEEYEDE